MITERKKRPQKCDETIFEKNCATVKKSNNNNCLNITTKQQQRFPLNFCNENSEKSLCKCQWLSIMQNRFIQKFYTLDRKAAVRQYTMLSGERQTISNEKELTEVIFLFFYLYFNKTIIWQILDLFVYKKKKTEVWVFLDTDFYF